MRRLADDAAIEEGVCMGVPAVREPWNGELKELEGLFTPKPRGLICLFHLGDARYVVLDSV